MFYTQGKGFRLPPMLDDYFNAKELNDILAGKFSQSNYQWIYKLSLSTKKDHPEAWGLLLNSSEHFQKSFEQILRVKEQNKFLGKVDRNRPRGEDKGPL